MTNPATPTSSSRPIHRFPLTALISLSALAHNLAEIRRSIPATCEILAVVKADAYGHGATTIAKTLAELGVQRFGVATVQEGIALRDSGISQAILVMGGLLPFHLPDLIHHRLTPVLSNKVTGDSLAQLLQPHPTPYPVHVKVDTGMRRLGFSQEAVIPYLQSSLFKGPFQLEGLMTHFAEADTQDSTITDNQLNRFRTTLKHLQALGLNIPILHAANSAGILYHPSSHLGMVRPGLMLYGYVAGPHSVHPVSLQPIMSVTTNVVFVRKVETGEPVGYHGSYRPARPSRIAVLPIGYDHGFPRGFSAKGMVLIRGRRVPIVGNICMDMMLVDITEVPPIDPGEEVVLIGKQGEEEISAEDWADWLETIPYEILCNIGPRANRVYEDREA